MLTRTIALLLFILPISLIAAPGTISGKVVEGKQGREMSYVTISLDSKAVAYTNNQGKFVIDHLEEGVYTLGFSFLGYEKIEIDNIVINSTNKNVILGVIRMNELSIRIPEVMVLASRTPYSERYMGSNQQISSVELKQSQPIGTEEALKTQAGVNVAGDMGISNRLNVGIRGSYPRRSGKILLLEDGSPIAPAPYLSPEAYYNPPSERLDGIEIIKGADILSYGPNTMYGVINYITRRPPAKPTLNVELSGGERNYNSQFISYGGTWNSTAAELQILNKGFDGFQENSESQIFNSTAKVYTDIGKSSNAYIKLNYHQETSLATYSGLTPLTYSLDPKKNPFDADELHTKRYAVDLIFNHKFNDQLSSSTKIYSSQFARDWWRQNTTLKKAKDVRAYVGDDIYFSKYNYLQGQNFTDDNYVRVGSISNGRESTLARNRLFRVAGAQESLRYETESGKMKNSTELGFRLHAEQFYNQELRNDSSRFARSGRIMKDEKYLLASTSVFLRNEFSYSKLTITPIARMEMIDMKKQDLLSLSSDPLNDGSKNYGAKLNSFSQFIPGISTAYHLIDTNYRSLTFYSGIYKGYTPPTTDFGFISVNDEGLINTSPKTNSEINMRPEISTNFEAGVRGFFLNNAINGQLTWFSNNIDNYYSPGRSEAFQTLGSVNITGMEAGLAISALDLIHKNNPESKHKVKISASYTLLNSSITSGVLKDSDLLKAKFTAAGKDELITKINTQRSGYNVYFAAANGSDSLVSRELSSADFAQIKNIEYRFGDDGITGKSVPYVPAGILNLALNYSFNGLSLGVNYNHVSSQYTDYMNLENESAEGAFGKLPAYTTIDLNASYKLNSQKSKFLNAMTVFATAKNIADEVYVASRLHRVSSGIMPAGFRQINAGLKISY